jgi:hypothetical protein
MIHLEDNGTGYIECDVCEEVKPVEGCETEAQVVAESDYIEDGNNHYCCHECRMQAYGMSPSSPSAVQAYDRSMR